MRKLIMAILSLVIVNSAFAENAIINKPDYYTLNNNDTVQVYLSSVDINRLTIKDDEISNIQCPTNFCTIDKKSNSSNGALIALNQGLEPFSLFVDTVNDRHFGLLVVPISQPAKTLIFEIEENKTEKIVKDMKAMPYQTRLTKLMKSAILAHENSTSLIGYSKHVVTEEKNNKTQCPRSRQDSPYCNLLKNSEVLKNKPTDQMLIIPKVVYHNDVDNIIVYTVKNLSSKEQKIRPNQFYVTGLQTLSYIPNIKYLQPNQSVTMYQIVNGRGLL